MDTVSEVQYQVIKQTRRANKDTSADIAVSLLNNTTTTQEEGIENGHNKTINKADNSFISTSLKYSHVDSGVNVCLQGCRCYDIS